LSGLSRRQLLSGITGSLASVTFAQTKRPKNVLLLMSDQHRPHALGIDGNPVAKTPNLDALARSAVRFDSAYCSNPVCVPSRASLLTGLYTHNHGAYNNTVPWPFEHKTIAHHFDRAGYMTGLIGKMHFVDAQTHGFEYRLDFNDWWQYLGPKTKLYAEELSRANSGSGMPQIDDLWRDSGDPWKGVRELDDRQGAVAVGRASKIPEQDHFESFVARESIRFLRNHGNQPFFLVSSFLKPHDPFMPAARFAEMFRPEDMKLPDTWGKVDLTKIPKEIRDVILRNGPTPELTGAEQAKRRIALYYANLAQMDDCLGRVLNMLRELDLEKDTIVLYTADHGEMLGEHGLWQKFVFYEPSVGVPLIVRAPGVSLAGARSNTPVSLVQALPTLLELCGLPAASGLDGASFAADLRQPSRTRDTTVFSEFNLRTPRAKYMIRRGDYKYNYYVNDTPELYNLRKDPNEMRNLALEPASAAKVEQMKGQLFAWHKPAELHKPL
jgi:choline-sulfatase